MRGVRVIESGNPTWEDLNNRSFATRAGARFAQDDNRSVRFKKEK